MCSTELVSDSASEDGPSSTTSSMNGSHISVSVNSMSPSGISGTTGHVMKMPDTTNRNPNRRSNKPIMEKRRRARINNCLNELKAILLEAMRKDPARHSKLEKADILELTVAHLKSLHRTTSGPGAVDINHLNARFRAGFTECINEVGRFLSSSAAIKTEGYGTGITTRLLSHLADCLGNPSMIAVAGVGSVGDRDRRVFKFESDGEPNNNYPLPHRPASFMNTSTSAMTPSNPAFNMSPIISLVPSRLPSGEFAFVVPGFNSSTIQAMSAGGSSVSDSNNNNARFVPSPLRAPHQQSMLLSPEVPLELTVSSPSISPAAYSVKKEGPGYANPQRPLSLPPTAHSQAYNKHQSLVNAKSRHLHHIPMTSRPEDYQGQQPLELVTPKRDDTDMSCWRPW